MKPFTLVLTVIEHGEDGQVERSAVAIRVVDDAEGSSGTPAALAGHAVQMAHEAVPRLEPVR